MSDGSVTLRCYSVNSHCHIPSLPMFFNAAAFCDAFIHLICL